MSNNPEKNDSVKFDANGVYSTPATKAGVKIRKTDWPRFVIHNYAGL